MRKGVVFTPLHWADWAVERFSLAEKWLRGSTVLDPGCGTGALSEALIRKAVENIRRPDEKDLLRLCCIDTDETAISSFRGRIREHYGIVLPHSSTPVADYLLKSPGIKADIVLANPPWVTFGDLENDRKESYKPIFRASGLTPDARNLLLGGSRIDIAALFVATALERDLAPGGEAYFFLPMSLYRGEGAHSAFRRLSLPGGRSFALREINNLEGGAPFPGAGTRHCFAAYEGDAAQSWPVPWFSAGPGGTWERMDAYPADGEGSPLLPCPAGNLPPLPPKIPVPTGTRPRQGVNTGGAVDVFVVRKTGPSLNGSVPVINKKGVEGKIPEGLLHPLMDHRMFSNEEETDPDRWIFLPYDPDGIVMSEAKLRSEADAWEWLNIHRKKLKDRKGSLIGRSASRGIWWSLLGVGPYAFSPWKLAWESYGRDSFRPKLFTPDKGIHWQGNQALHAYLPFYNGEKAEKALNAMRNPGFEEYLRRLGGANTKGWAQPGRVRRLLEENQ